MKTTQEKIQVMQAWLDGKQIETCTFGRYMSWSLFPKDIEPDWNWEYHDYRIKPGIKYIPFTKDNLPYQALFRSNKSEDKSTWGLVSLFNDTEIQIGTYVRSYQYFLDHYQYSEDRVIWKICGTPIEQ